MKSIIDKAKRLFLDNVSSFGSDPFHLVSHVFEMERWAKFMLKRYSADEAVVLLSVWLHDIGHYPVLEGDHAVRSEIKARQFLVREGCPKEKMEAVLHCVRAHRCKDVLPASIEAKIVAFIDSASHMTDSMYFEIARDDKVNDRKFRAYAKMDRDFRDLSLFPEEKELMRPLFDAWKKLIREYEKIEV